VILHCAVLHCTALQSGGRAGAPAGRQGRGAAVAGCTVQPRVRSIPAGAPHRHRLGGKVADRRGGGPPGISQHALSCTCTTLLSIY
jgi:hypothetical protein